MNKLAKLKAMSGNERRLLLQAWLLLPVVRIMLWLAGYRRTFASLKFLLRLSGDQNDANLAETASRDWHQQAATFGRLVNGAATHSLIVVNCLPRSLVLWWMLRRAGLAVDLRIGVQKEADVFAAHAWVEYAGVPVNDQSSEQYSPILSTFAPLESKTL
ncbi:MAG: lasso peptide biosynthesis B2 protein [Acidobacteria bacterium]|nr:lasso peptide biosynthesis B2 protein [Acidobacteriota bacterium]